MNDEMREPMAWVAWNPNGLAWVFGKLPTRAECGCWSGTMGLFGPGGCGAARCPGMDRKGDVAAWAAEPVALYAGTLGAEHEPQEAEAQDDPEPEEAPASPGVLEAAREAIKRVAIYSRVYVDLLDEDGWDSEEGKTMAHALCALRDASTEQRVRKECMAALPQATPVPVKVSVDRGVVSKWALRISHAPTEDGVAGCVLPLNGKCRMSAGRMLVSLLQLLGVPAVLESDAEQQATALPAGAEARSALKEAETDG